ncbi:MAG: thiol oxidoreductase [Opitutaceae bacterium]|nr:thiol oxidoreductase [Opitutaceae bacterium]
MKAFPTVALLFGSFVACSLLNGFYADELAGGDTTVFLETKDAFSLPAKNLELTEHPRFFAGNAFFNTNWVDASSIVDGRDGLGPLFNVRSCSACHFKDGRGRPPIKGEISNGWLMRISIPGRTDHGAPLPDPIYGNQISVRALPGAKPEASIRISYQERTGNYPDGSTFTLLEPRYSMADWAYGEPSEELLFSPRGASQVFGLGLLEAVSEAEILSRADPLDEDKDGISGRPNRVWSPSSDQKVLGRFGWKANKADLMDQTAGAFVGDIGITNSVFPDENHTVQQELTKNFPSGGTPEISIRDLQDVVFYLQTLAVPAARIRNQDEFEAGKALFWDLQCSTCHAPELRTPEDYAIEALAGQTFRPYTDLLLHDMGAGLADSRPDFDATGSEWRTPPLWGIGLFPKVNEHSRLLHDGRARNVEEAILWHGGEAEQSKQSFKKQSRSKRELIIRFVESL